VSWLVSIVLVGTTVAPIAGCVLKAGGSAPDAGEDTDAPAAIADAACAQTQWWDLAFSHRQTLSFADDSLTDFPILVVLTPSRFDYAAAKPDGTDIRFVAADGLEIPHEVEDWSANGESTLWLRPSTTNAPIHLYYGNASATDGARPADVWSDSFGAVWHLADSGGSSLLADSTGNGNGGMPVGGVETTGGFLGGAMLFNGVDTYIDVDADRSMASADITLEAVVRVDDPDALAYQTIVEHSRSGTNWYGLWKADTGPVFHFRWATTENLDFEGTVVADTDYYVAATFDSQSGTVTTYVDGVVDRVSTAATNPVADAGRLLIGAAALNPLSEFFAGVISEVRVSTVARSGSWLAAQHQSLDDAFVSYAGTETSCQ